MSRALRNAEQIHSRATSQVSAVFVLKYAERWREKYNGTSKQEYTTPMDIRLHPRPALHPGTL